MPTRTDLIVRVLDLLGVTQVGQDPSAEDAEKVGSFIPSAVSDLTGRRVVDINLTSDGSISDAYFEPFATILASRSGPAFGQPRASDVEAREEGRLSGIQSKYSRRRRAA